MKRWHMVVLGVLALGVACGVASFAVIRGLRSGLKTALVPPTTLTPRIPGIDTMTAADATAHLARLAVPVSDQSLLRYVKDGNEDLVRLLLIAGANPSAVDPAAGRCALHEAANHPGKAAILEALLKAGANANAQDKALQTPLFIAAIVRNRPGVRILLEAGADPWIQKNTGEVALDYADHDDIRTMLSKAMDKPRPATSPRVSP